MLKILTQAFILSLSLFFLLFCSGGAKNSSVVVLQENQLPDSTATTNQGDKEVYFSRVKEETPSPFDGFLRLKTDIGSGTIDTIYIYNEDDSHFGYFFMKEMEPSFIGKEPFLIESYYPEFYVIIFKADSISSSNSYAIKVNGATKYIKHVPGVTIYETVQQHLYNSYIGTDSDNPLREQASFKSDLVVEEVDYSKLSFEVKEIKENWAFVVCNADCEGCPEGNTGLSGWVKILSEGKIIVNMYYVC